MLEKPDLPDEEINTCLQDDFGLSVAQISFLPIGADFATAVYHAVTADGRAYFVKLRRLALALAARSPEFIVYHFDIHAGNILISDDGSLYIVDWDDPILAPKERDLMYVGGGLMGRWYTPEEEEAFFCPAYGQTEIDARAMAYYRYERIIEDIAVCCEELLLTNDGGEDREQSLHYLKSNFLPEHTIEIAYRSDTTTSKQ